MARCPFRPVASPAGVTAGPTGVVASVDVRGEIDLVVWWSGSTRPSSDLLEQLRLLARLAAYASRQDGAALSSLYAVARQLLASRDREEVLLGLATAAADVLDAEIAGVFLATPDGAHLEAQAVVGHRSMATARLRLARGESMVGHVFATGEVYRSDDWTTDPVISKELLPVATVEGTKACIGAPMRLDGAVVGVLAAWRRRRSVYTDDDVALIGTLATSPRSAWQRALDDDRLRDLSEQLMTANSELSRRYEETRQTLEIHRRLMRVVVDGADLGSVVEALRAITGQEVAFVGPDAARCGRLARGAHRDGPRAGPRSARRRCCWAPTARGGRRSRSTSGRPVSAGAGSRSPPGCRPRRGTSWPPNRPRSRARCCCPARTPRPGRCGDWSRSSSGI